MTANEKQLTEFKGTQGRWHFTKRLGSLEMYADRVVEFDIICNFERSSSGVDETMANAKLISKAPEMLEILQECVLQLKYLSEKFGETGTGNNVISRAKTLIHESVTP